MPALPALTTPLSHGAVTVRAYAERDIPEILIAYQDDDALHTRLGERRPPSGAELGREWEDGAAARAAGSRCALSILAPGSDVCAGRVVADEIDWANEHAEVKVWVVPQHRRRGLGSGALRLVCEWLLSAGGLARIGLRIEPSNEAMLLTAAAAGFTSEGLLRSYERDPDGRGRHDIVSMSLVAADLG
jgi:RimJ/RimL family protein N-acetyltransferase